MVTRIGRSFFSLRLGWRSSTAGSPSSCRSMVNATDTRGSGIPPIGEGGLQFEKKSYPSFWQRLKQQKAGLGNMALSASIISLAVSIIRQDKELTQSQEMAARLRTENDALLERLESVKSVVQGKDGTGAVDSDLASKLREMLSLNDSEDVAELEDLGSPSGKSLDNSLRSQVKSKFMI